MAQRSGRVTLDYGEPLLSNLKRAAAENGFTSLAELARHLGREYLGRLEDRAEKRRSEPL